MHSSESEEVKKNLSALVFKALVDEVDENAILDVALDLVIANLQLSNLLRDFLLAIADKSLDHCSILVVLELPLVHELTKKLQRYKILIGDLGISR